MTLELFKLIKPLIHPQIKADETPLGYLIRVAELNHYKSYRWLFESDINSKAIYLKSHHRLYNILAKSGWTRCSLSDPIVKEVLSLNSGYFLCEKFRYCPLCIREHGYYKIKWQYRISIACTYHGIWLQDCCYACGSAVAMGNSKIRECSCGADITEANVEKAAEEVVLMQHFFEREYETTNDDSLVLSTNHKLLKKERMDILNFFAKWLRGRFVTSIGVSRHLRNMSTARDNMADVAEALFGGRLGYHNFLKRLHKLGFASCNDSIDLFTKFYRIFYRDFPQACFKPHKDYLEQYLNMHWEKPLSRRNRHFDDSTLLAHPWIPLQTACREYDIHKSKLKQAIRQNMVRSKNVEKECHNSIIIYKPDLEDRLYRIKDLISAKEAALILGLTKLQFIRLRESSCFNVMVKPGEYGNATWHFSEEEIHGYLDLFLVGLPEASGDYWTFSQLLQFFGGQIEDSLITVLKAIEEANLKVAAKTNSVRGLPSMLFNKNDFLEWFENYKARLSLISIPAAAKLLNIQQQFAYQLVKAGLLELSSSSEGSTRWLSQTNIDQFQQRYVLLSKLAKKTKQSSRSLISYLASFGIFPVDQDWEVPLRQKVYFKAQLSNVRILVGAL